MIRVWERRKAGDLRCSPCYSVEVCVDTMGVLNSEKGKQLFRLWLRKQYRSSTSSNSCVRFPRIQSKSHRVGRKTVGVLRAMHWPLCIFSPLPRVATPPATSVHFYETHARRFKRLPPYAPSNLLSPRDDTRIRHAFS